MTDTIHYFWKWKRL